jgi:serine/threonine protein kinase
VPDPASASPVKEGDLVAGKYRVERILGMGGMGVVVCAMHVELEQRVALKFLLPAGAADPIIVKRFTREARAAAKIHSEHVARVFDVGTLEGGSPFIVMEYMDGEDLEHVLRREGRLTVEAAVGYILQASEALAEAHALGIVHRDLKPANLFLAKRPSGAPIVKVSDFGISKLAPSASEAGLTQTSTMLGSPAYMAPEQMSAAKDADARLDVWGLGVVLYELLAGHRPFNADSLPELVVNILHRPPDPMGRFDIPQGLDLAIRTCLEKSPKSRFQNVAQLAAAIAPFAASRGQDSVDRISHVLGVTTTTPLSMAATIPASGPHPSALPPHPSGYPQPSAFPRSADEGKLASAGVGTNGSWGGSIAGATTPERPSRALRVLGLALLVGVSLGIGGGIVWLERRPSEIAATSTPPLPSTAPPAPAASVTASAAPLVAEALATAATPPLVASAPPPVTAPPTPPAAAHKTPPRPPVSPPPPAAATIPATTPPTAKPNASNCHIVSSIDPDGTERFKKVCN